MRHAACSPKLSTRPHGIALCCVVRSGPTSNVSMTFRGFTPNCLRQGSCMRANDLTIKGSSGNVFIGTSSLLTRIGCRSWSLSWSLWCLQDPKGKASK
jgi:hypothetical protein